MSTIPLHQDTEECLNSLQRSLKILSETQDIGTSTLEELNIQGEKLDRINNNISIINQKQQESSKLLTYLSGIWSRMTTSFRDPFLIKQPTQSISDTCVLGSFERSPLQNSSTLEINSDMLLEQLSKSMDNIKAQATEMNITLVSQNKTIDNINTRMDVTNINMDRLNNKIKTIIK